jgi:hypothetical protein
MRLIILILLLAWSCYGDYLTVEPITTSGGKTCINDHQCSMPSGTCVNGSCICNTHYYAEDCSYKAKDAQTGAALFALVAAGVFGVSRLYLGYIGVGVGQLLMGCGGWILSIPLCVFLCAQHRVPTWLIILIKVLIAGALVTSFFWCMADCILIATGQVLYDGNGYPLIPVP